MLAVFATTALALGLIGVYGVAWYSARQRRREIGVRTFSEATGVNARGQIVGRVARIGAVLWAR